ncbi:MAG: polyprenyl synthetase family protein [Patescibacteria group bacterium]|nr:polyprenyl synthetase family protein [Patescibacteria group bacterium]
MTNNQKFKLFNQIMADYQQKINLELEKFFQRKIKEAGLISQKAADTIKVLKEFNLRGGKRARPILINTGYFLAGGRDKKAILKASLCAELIHNFFLIHDDIIDQDELRRGKLSLHALYQKKFGGNSYKGVSFAIIAGDIGNVLGFQALTESNFSERNKIKALNILNEMVERTCHGEMLEMFLKEEKKIKKSDIEKVLKYKTAYYAFVAPLKIGAVLAGGNSKLLKKIEKFALPVGSAFQIQDDILGIFGSQKKIGKPVGSDITENQPNLLIRKTLSLAKAEARRKFQNYLGKSKISQKDICDIRRIIKESGALDYCRRKAEKLVKEAKASMLKFTLPGKEKQFLLDLSDYVIKRDY